MTDHARAAGQAKANTATTGSHQQICAALHRAAPAASGGAAHFTASPVTCLCALIPFFF